MREWTLEQLKSFLGDLSSKDVKVLKNLIRTRTGRDLEIPIVFIAGHIEESGLPHWGKVDVEGVCPLYQPPATLNQANPVAGTWYTVLSETESVRMCGMGIKCTWTVQTKPLQLRITIDGEVMIPTIDSPISNTYYIPRDVPYSSNLAFQTFSYNHAVAFLLEGRSVQVEAQCGSTTPGTVSKLSASMKWAKW